MFVIEFTLDFKEPNGLEKEGHMQHNVAFQLMRLAQFWTSLFNIQITKEVNEDNSIKITRYTFPDQASYDDFLAHSGDNGVDLTSLFNNYKTEVEALGGTISSNIDSIFGGALRATLNPPA